MKTLNLYICYNGMVGEYEDLHRQERAEAQCPLSFRE
jgi:hypothetical protein